MDLSFPSLGNMGTRFHVHLGKVHIVEPFPTPSGYLCKLASNSVTLLARITAQQLLHPLRLKASS